jgi:hypothetical protein
VRAELAAEQRAAQRAADYQAGLQLSDAGQWKEAVGVLERITRLDSTYQDASALLDRARQELGQAAAIAQEHVQRQRAARRAAAISAMWSAAQVTMTVPRTLMAPAGPEHR